MSDDVHFGIIDQFDFVKHYDELDDDFTRILVKYHCVNIPDDIVNDWVSELSHICTHWHWYGRESSGLAQFGVTLFPPVSLNDFLCVIQEYVAASSSGKNKLNIISPLIRLLNQALTQNKWVIHFGL